MKGRIVLIDDEKLIRTTIQLFLKRLGYEVFTSGEPRCPLYDMSPQCSHDAACADFLIIDNHMPKMSGLDFIERQSRLGCKAIAPHKAVMSGLWSDEELERADLLGCRIFTKPFPLEELSGWLRSLSPPLNP